MNFGVHLTERRDSSRQQHKSRKKAYHRWGGGGESGKRKLQLVKEVTTLVKKGSHNKSQKLEEWRLGAEKKAPDFRKRLQRET